MSLVSFLGPVAEGLASGFAAYGKWASSGWRPGILIIGTVAFAGAMAAGISQQTISSDAAEIFTPITSTARDDNLRFDALFPSTNSSDAAEFVIRLPSGSNIWSAAAINTLESVWQQTLALTVTLSTGRIISFSDICDAGSFSGCSRVVASDCLTAAEKAPLGSVTAVAISPPPASRPWAGAAVTASSSLALSFTFQSGDETSPVEPALSKEDVAIEFQQAWIVKATAMQAAVELEGWTAAFGTSQSAEFALEESTGGDILLVILAIVLLVNFAIFSGVSSDCVRSRHSIAVGGVAAVALAIPASFGLMAFAGVPYVATIGTTPFLVLAVGVDSTFVILSAFNRRTVHEAVSDRVAAALHEAGPAITLTTVTDVLAFVIGGLTSPFRAVNFFCLYTGTALALAFVFVLTVFVPLLALDGLREVSGRSALTFCLVPGRAVGAVQLGKAAKAAVDAAGDAPSPPGGPAELASKSAAVADARPSTGSFHEMDRAATQPPAAADPGGSDEEEDEEYQGKACDRIMGNVLAPAITTPIGLVLVIIAWIGLLGASAFGVTQIREGLALSDLAVDGHHLVRYDQWNVAYFSLGFPFNMFTDAHAPIDLADGSLREALRRLPKQVNEIEATITSSPDSFFDSLATYLGPNSTQTLPTTTIDAALLALLSDPTVQAQFDKTVLFTRVSGSTSTDIPHSEGFRGAAAALAEGDRVLVRHGLYSVRTKSLPTSTERADAMVATRAAASAAVSALEPAAGRLGRATVQFDAFVFFEADVVLAPATFGSLALGIAAIAIVALVLLPHLAAVLIVVVAVASIDLMLLGAMPLFGTKLNTVSGINLLLSIGLSVDAVAHVSHAFLHSREPLRAARRMVTWNLMTDDYPATCCGCVGGAERRRRAVAAVLTMARPVLQGTGSSMLGLIVLAFSTSSIFRIFFQILFTTIVLSLVHALVLVPVILALIGPIETTNDATELQTNTSAGSKSGLVESTDASTSAATTRGSAETGSV